MNRRQKAFLAAFRECGNVRLAATAADVGRRTHYDWLQDPAYAAAFADAREDAAELLEQEARRRALVGVDEPLSHQGQISYHPAKDTNGCILRDADNKVVSTDVPQTVKKFSDVLLMFLIKGAKPNTYRDNVKVEHTGELSVITERLAAARKRVKQRDDANGEP